MIQTREDPRSVRVGHCVHPILVIVLLCAALVPVVAGHGNIVLPPSWFDADGSIGQTAGKLARTHIPPSVNLD